MPRVYGPHRKSWDTAWTAHFLTFTCFGHQRFFTKKRTCEWFLESLRFAKEKTPFELWGYVLMPQHVHLLIVPADEVRIAQILYQIKQPVAMKAIKWLKENDPSFLARLEDRQPSGRVTHRFWLRGGGYDRNLRSARDIHEKLHYLHNNPVRQGIVVAAPDYPWSSARAWATEVDEIVKIDRETFPILQL